eukprot:1205559-Pyramimonas_sp.AAC.1
MTGAQVLASLALNYEETMMPSVVAGVVDALHKHEHLPALVAELAQAATLRHGDVRLAVALLREVYIPPPLLRLGLAL